MTHPVLGGGSVARLGSLQEDKDANMQKQPESMSLRFARERFAQEAGVRVRS